MPEFITVVTLGAAVAKALSRDMLPNPATQTLATELIDFFKDTQLKENDRRSAAAHLAKISAKIAAQLRTDSQNRELRHLDTGRREAILREVVAALEEASASTEQLIETQLNATTLTKKLLARPIRERFLEESELALYRQMIHKASTQLIRVAPQLPDFQHQIWSEILKRLAELQAERATKEEAARAWEASYRDTVAKKLNRFDPFGAPDYSDEYEYQPLDISYVRLDYTDITQHRARPNITAFLSRATEEVPPQRSGTVDDLLHKAKRLAIRGEAGSGKTTLARWLAVQAASQSFTGNLNVLNDCVPFYIRLRDCVLRERVIPSASDFPSLVAPDLIATMPTGWVEKKLQIGQAMVILDGVDEVPGELRDVVLDRLDDLLISYPLAVYIVTSRPSAIARQQWSRWIPWTRQNGFREAALARLTPGQVQYLIEKWHAAVKALLHREPEAAAEVAALAPRLLRLLRHRPALRKLAENPLLCAMICAVHRVYQDQLASQRLELYRQCVEMLLHGRDVRRKVKPDSPLAKLSLDQKRLILGHFALQLFERGLAEIANAEADHFFDRQVRLLRQRDLTAKLIRQFYVERTNLLQSPASDRLEFTHRSFQEYLAAQVVASSGSLSLLHERVTDDNWRELIILAIGQASQPAVEDFLGWLLDQEDQNQSQVRKYQLLALACLETVQLLDPDLQARIESHASAYVPPTTDDEAKILAQGGDPLIPLLAVPPKEIQSAALCVLTLGLIGTNAALSAIRKYAINTSLPIADQLGRIWPYFDRDEYAQAIWRERNDVVIPSLDYLDTPNLMLDKVALGVLEASDLRSLAGLSNLTHLNLSGPFHNCASG